jgi:manganese oxidase
MCDFHKILFRPIKAAGHFLMGVTVGVLLGSSPAPAAPLDFFGPPPAGDPSAFTGPFIGLNFAGAILATLPPANEGALMLQGGAVGTPADVGVNNVLPPALQPATNVPTGGFPSPLFGAQPFTQTLLRFEELGREPLDPASPAPTGTFPEPTVGPAPEQDPVSVAASAPSGTALDAFLAQPGIAPFPMRLSNSTAVNPWKADIEAFVGRTLNNPPAEGRPPGEAWSHQRWNEFFPQVFIKTVQTGARVNEGLRDSMQLHGYGVGEFGPGGLYHNTAGLPTTEGTTKGIAVRFHPNMPIQDHKSLWTFDGTVPPKLVMARYGEAVLLRHYNALPIDPAANRGFGLHTITTHEHNGHSGSESDGYTNAFFFPGQFYDYRWPMELAGYDTVNTTASDPRAAFPCVAGETLFVNDANPGFKTCENGRIQIRGDFRETMSTHWFHDHMLDFTAQNVYKGNAAMLNFYSALDRGNEAVDDGVNLRLPSGTALPWGNRDYDVNLLVADKAWDREGQLWFNIFNLDGFIGDEVLVNWLWRPYLDVRARSYRFRILNGSVSRVFKFALVRQVVGDAGEFPGPPGSGVSYDRVPFHMIANDGNVMEHAVAFDARMGAAHNGILPDQGVAERYDIIVNFAKHGIMPGDKIYFVNVLEHTVGRRPGNEIPLAAILSEQYKPVMEFDAAGLPVRWVGGDPAVGRFMEFRVKAYSGTDLSMNPAEFEPGGKTMIPLPIRRDDPRLQTAIHHTINFARSSPTDQIRWTIATDGGAAFGMDPRRISMAPQLSTGPTPAGFSGNGTLEIWHFTGANGWSHPVHVHFEEGIILTRGGVLPPPWELWARKDMYRLGAEAEATQSVEMAVQFREFAGTYMEHCHNTQHEDHSMLQRFDVEHPGQIKLMPAPMPTWEGVEFVDSDALPTFRTGDGLGPAIPIN